MANKKDIDQILILFKECRKNHLLHMFDDMNKGAFAVLKYLSENNNFATCGDISVCLDVSTARVAVILKKLEDKNFITKQVSESDARITIVSLSENGKNLIIKKDEEFKEKIEIIIDSVGIEKIFEFISISNKINHIMKSEHKIVEKEFIDDKNI